MKAFLQQLSPLGQLTFAVLFSFISVALFQFLGVFLIKLFYGYSPEDMILAMDFSNPDFLDVTVIFSVLNGLGMFLLPALTFASFVSDNPYEYLKVNRTIDTILIGISIVLAVLSLPIINYTSALNLLVDLPDWMLEEENKREELITLFLEQKSLWLNLFLLAIIPAISEEFFFRGIIQRLLNKVFKGKHHIAVILTAIMFSAMHIQFAGFLPRFFMGLVLGYLFVYSKSLWPSIILHFCNNAISVVLATLIISDESYSKIDEIGTAIDLTSTVVTIVSLGVMIFLFKKVKQETLD